MSKSCDDCIHYCWYWDRCEKWECEVDGRECHSCCETKEETNVHKGKENKYMETPFANDMFSIFYKAFKRLCPNKDVTIQWVNDLEPLDGEDIVGVTHFASDGTIEIEILTRQSVAEAVGTLIHELAHAIVGPIKEHGEDFKNACDSLIKEYEKILDEEFGDCITLELSTTDKI